MAYRKALLLSESEFREMCKAIRGGLRGKVSRVGLWYYVIDVLESMARSEGVDGFFIWRKEVGWNMYSIEDTAILVMDYFGYKLET